MSRVVYKASCWDWQDFYYTDKTKQRLHDRKTEHFKYETLACIAGGILLPGVLFWGAEQPHEVSGEAAREYPLEYTLFSRPRNQNNTAALTLIPPAMHAGYYEWQSLLCYCQPCHVINGTISKFWQREQSDTHCKIKETDCWLGIYNLT